MDTATVFALRKSGNHTEAFEMAKALYRADHYDIWVQKAYAWTLIDSIKLALTENNITQAQTYFDQLCQINFESTDDIITSQINFLRPKLVGNYSKIQEAENLSKSGNHKDALALMLSLLRNNELLDIHHEAYGWIIYRYIKAEELNLTSIETRTFMRDYLKLKNERPSLLHSMFLNFALHFSKDHPDFNLYKYFLLWDPQKLRDEDVSESYRDEKTFSSLISRIFKEFIDKKYQIDLNGLIQIISTDNPNPLISKQEVLDLIREPFYWLIYNAEKENHKDEIWKLFNDYNIFFKDQPGSEWHSKILNSADFIMKDNDEWRFLPFFQAWNPNNLRDNDWKEVKKDDKTFKSLGVKSLNKVFELIKSGHEVENLIPIINSYSIAIEKNRNDVWLKREKAILLVKTGQKKEALNIYKSLILEIGDQAYTWHEFSKCVEIDFPKIAIGMLSKAILLQHEEDYLGDIRLELANLLINNNSLNEASVELNLYKKHRELKGWKFPDQYLTLYQKIIDVQVAEKDNVAFYTANCKLAEEYAYQDIKWTELVLVEKWKKDNIKEKVKFIDGKSIEFSVSQNRFSILKKSEIGQIFDFKLHKKVIEKEINFIPLLIQKSNKPVWSILEETNAVIDYINSEKNTIHAITFDNNEVHFLDDAHIYKTGDFIKGHTFKKDIKGEIRYELRNISKIEKESVLENFPKTLAVVDGVNNEKKLFHFIAHNRIQGIVRYEESPFIPNEGDFISLKLIHKRDHKTNKIIYRPIEILKTDEESNTLRKRITGELVLKFKRSGSTVDFKDLDFENDNLVPDFGFIGDYYVPKYLLEKYKISKDCYKVAMLVFSGDKWKVYDLNEDFYLNGLKTQAISSFL